MSAGNPLMRYRCQCLASKRDAVQRFDDQNHPGVNEGGIPDNAKDVRQGRYGHQLVIVEYLEQLITAVKDGNFEADRDCH